MSTSTILAALKQALKARAITYADLGEALGLSEPSIKRLFAGGDLKLSRLLQICELCNIQLETLMASVQRPSGPGTPLPRSTEQALADVPARFYFLLLLIEQFTPDQIRQAFELSPASIELYLADLERLGVIERGPGTSARLIVPVPIRWRWEGPLAPVLRRVNQVFVANVMGRDGSDEAQFISNTRRMRPETLLALRREIEELRQRFRDLAREDQLTHPDRALVTVKWTSALAEIDFRELAQIPEHGRLKDGKNGP
ncbi:MAG: helix-turn-helix transcriptional regulator [Neomegalonema sp.]|nr:helix-turn-helix transcriptional regulator [Neomegalonema sp.]